MSDASDSAFWARTVLCGMVPIGVALAAAGNGVSTVRVRFDGVATQAAA